MQRARTTDARTPWQRLASYTESSAQSTETRGNTTSGGQKRQMHTEKQAGQMPMTFQLSKIKTGPPAVRPKEVSDGRGATGRQAGCCGDGEPGPPRRCPALQSPGPRVTCWARSPKHKNGNDDTPSGQREGGAADGRQARKISQTQCHGKRGTARAAPAPEDAPH